MNVCRHSNANLETRRNEKGYYCFNPNYEERFLKNPLRILDCKVDHNLDIMKKTETKESKATTAKKTAKKTEKAETTETAAE